MRDLRVLILFALLAAISACLLADASGAPDRLKPTASLPDPRPLTPGPLVLMIRLSGAIDVPSQEYLQRALKVAEARNAQALLILLNTPGGLGEPMKAMTEALLNAPLPTIVYVYPAGAYAMSAGTFVTMAANIAVMHPATSIGAAHPVSLTGPTPQSPGSEEQPAPSDVMSQKVENAFAEQAKVIAAARGRNTAWAEKAVRQSITASAREAVKLKVVDLLADSPSDLLQQLEGRKVTLPSRQVVTLHTANAPLEELPATAKERFLHVLADPNMLLILLALASLGIMFELQNPGAILPGVIGGFALLLALYSMSVLPVSYAGVGLIIFAMLLFLADIKIASHGILSIGGIFAFIVGALMLTNTEVAPGLHTAWQVAVVIALLVAAFFLIVIGASVRAHFRPVKTGLEGMTHRRGKTLEALTPLGNVLVEGEIWRARALDGELGPGEKIEVVGEEHMTLLVRKKQES